MATGIALMSGGVAAMKNGVAIAAAGSSTCCCGGTGPGGCVPPDPNGCGCSSNPQCPTLTYFRRLQTFGFSGGGQTLTDVYNIPETCCCGPNGAGHPWRYTHRRVLRIYNAYNTHQPCTAEVTTCSGSGVGPGLFSCTKSGKDLYNCEAIECQPDRSGILTPSCAPGQPPIDFCYSIASQQVGASGFLYRDCFTWAQESTFVYLSAGSYLYDSISTHMEVGPSSECPLGPGCGACCCSGRCYGGLSSSQCLGMGGIFQGVGTHCAAVRCRSASLPGACCLPGDICVQTTESQCLAGGGAYLGDFTVCGELPCPVIITNPPPTAACCRENGTCDEMTLAMCTSTGGFWHPGEHCATFTCPPLQGGCCLWDPQNGGDNCQIMSPSQCATNSGIFRGIGTICDSSTCNGSCCNRNHNSPTGWSCDDPQGVQFCTHNGGVFLGFYPEVVCNGSPDPRCPSNLGGAPAGLPPRVRGTRGFF